jgi:hypothetical protein
MIDIAFGLQVAVRDSVQTDDAITLASTILYDHMHMSEDTMRSALLALVSEVASMSSFLTAEVCLGEDGFQTLNSTIEMLQEMGNN